MIESEDAACALKSRFFSAVSQNTDIKKRSAKPLNKESPLSKGLHLFMNFKLKYINEVLLNAQGQMNLKY